MYLGILLNREEWSTFTSALRQIWCDAGHVPRLEAHEQVPVGLTRVCAAVGGCAVGPRGGMCLLCGTVYKIKISVPPPSWGRTPWGVRHLAEAAPADPPANPLVDEAAPVGAGAVARQRPAAREGGSTCCALP